MSEVRYFDVAGITLAVSADLPIGGNTFHHKFGSFEVDAPGGDVIEVHHHFGIPPLEQLDLGPLVQSSGPWEIHHNDGIWAYVGVLPDAGRRVYRVVLMDESRGHVRIYNEDAAVAEFERGGVTSIFLFPTDQVLLARLLAHRQALILHSSAALLDGQGVIFVGHSSAGKSTTLGMLGPHAQVLCDDRNIVRLWDDGFRVHGTWSNGDVLEVSGAGGPLRALMFIHQAPENRLARIESSRRLLADILDCIVRPLETAEWWRSTLSVVEAMVRDVPCYDLYLDRTGAARALVQGLAKAE